MHIIKLNAIDSTNVYLKSLSSNTRLKDYTVVVAKHQTQGRGQMGALWHVEKGKNLTCSVFKRMNKLSVDESFYISMITSLAITRVLQNINIPRLHVKWPNDILAEEKKVCGILIENIIKNGKIEGSIIGFGLNLNQSKFEGLPRASSLKLLTGKLFDIDEILQQALLSLQDYFFQFENGNHGNIKEAYEALLFRKDKPSTFKDKEGNLFPGYIKGVNDFGHLQVLLEDDIVKSFAMKEIELLY